VFDGSGRDPDKRVRFPSALRTKSHISRGNPALLPVLEKPTCHGIVTSVFRFCHATSRANVIQDTQAARPERSNDVADDVLAQTAVAAESASTSSVARCSLRRQILKTGAECGKSARSDLRGGRSVMCVATAIETFGWATGVAARQVR
jgi:hypothetical protein